MLRRMQMPWTTMEGVPVDDIAGEIGTTPTTSPATLEIDPTNRSAPLATLDYTPPHVSRLGQFSSTPAPLLPSFGIGISSPTLASVSPLSPLLPMAGLTPVVKGAFITGCNSRYLCGMPPTLSGTFLHFATSDNYAA